MCHWELKVRLVVFVRQCTAMSMRNHVYVNDVKRSSDPPPCQEGWIGLSFDYLIYVRPNVQLDRRVSKLGD